jgi:hypothetical protein
MHPLTVEAFMKYLSVLISVVTFCYLSYASSGTSGFEFLRIDFSTRSSSMGSAFTAMQGDVNGIFHNPAGIAFAKDRQFTFNYVNYLLDINGGIAAYSQAVDFLGRLSGAVVYLDYGSFDETNEYADKTGRQFGAHDIAFALSLADSLETYFTYGITFKYVHSKIDMYSASAVALDAGLLYEAPFQDDLVFGISILNFGTALSAMYQTKEKLPLSVNIAASKKLAHLPLTLNLELYHVNQQEENIWKRLKKARIGGEFALSEMLRLRLGYDNDIHGDMDIDAESGVNFGGVTLGLGLLWKRYRFDYGFYSYHLLGTVHRIGINGSI